MNELMAVVALTMGMMAGELVPVPDPQLEQADQSAYDGVDEIACAVAISSIANIDGQLNDINAEIEQLIADLAVAMSQHLLALQELGPDDPLTQQLLLQVQVIQAEIAALDAEFQQLMASRSELIDWVEANCQDQPGL